MAHREALHRFLDELPYEMLDVAQAALKRVCDTPVIRAVYAAPEDDEPLAEEERLDLERAVAAGEIVSDEAPGSAWGVGGSSSRLIAMPVR